MIVDIFLKIARNEILTQSEIEELSSYISASHTTTAKITNMQEISELAYDLGEVWAGRFIASANPNNNDVASSTFTGTYMDAAGVTGKNNGTVQAQLKSSDGTITAGAGAVTLNADGIVITGSGKSNINSVKFYSGTTLLSDLVGYTTSVNQLDIETTNNYSGDTLVQVYANAKAGQNGIVWLRAFAASATPPEINIKGADSTTYINYSGLVVNDTGGDYDVRIEGDTDANLFVADAGLDAIGMGGAAESGKKLKVTGAAHITGDVTMDGAVTLGDAAADTLTFNGTPAGQIVAGTYTPSLTNTTNVAASTARVCQYMRVGSVVTVSGSVNIDPTATGSTVLTMSLPIASNFANTYELGGSGAPDITTPIPVVIRGSSTADAAIFVFNATSTAAQEVYFTFTYRII